ncbi:MAG TPA: hypothetical protein VKG26_13665, partial [Bacteroidia bacterium]|nr:hypothetical protein [Bacteroidia bacterium]
MKKKTTPHNTINNHNPQRRMMGRKRKFSKLHYLRLLLFAQHLEKCRLEDYPMDYYWESHSQRAPYIINYDTRVAFLCFPYVLHEMDLFSEWEWIEQVGIMVYKNNQQRYTTNEEGIVEFFGLTNAEYCRYLVPLGHKKSTLHLRSTPKEVACGLYELIGLKHRVVL